MPSKSACPRPLCGGVHACAFSLLAEDMKYSWWHGGIGCRAKSALTGLSCLQSILEELSLSPLFIKPGAEEEDRDVRRRLHQSLAHIPSAEANPRTEGLR